MGCNDSPSMNVKCSVDNCYYNKNHMCNANKLEINSMENGDVVTSDGTCCTTFKNKK